MKTRIKELREEMGITQKELAEQSQVSERQIIRIEKEQTNPNSMTLNLIASALFTTVGYLLCETDEKRPLHTA